MSKTLEQIAQQLIDANGFVKGFQTITADSNADQALLYTGKAAMMLALMTCVLLLGLTGHLQTTESLGDSEALEEVHEALASGLLGLAGLHAAAALVMGWLEGTNLIGAMITGVKRRKVR